MSRSPADPVPACSNHRYVHIVGYTQWLLDRLRLKIPRALCGASLVGDPAEPDPLAMDAPTCPKCLERCPNFPGRRP